MTQNLLGIKPPFSVHLLGYYNLSGGLVFGGQVMTKFENSRFSPRIIALEYNHWLNNEKMETGIPLEKREGWLIAKVLKNEKEFPEIELKTLLQLFQNQMSINMTLILQAHLACVKVRV